MLGSLDRQNSVVDALFKPYLEQGADIGSCSLADLAASAGLEAALFLQTEEGTADVKSPGGGRATISASVQSYFL